VGIKVFNPDFDPYDALVNISERMVVLQEAHNNLANAYERTQREVQTSKNQIRNLQQSHAHLNELVFDLLNEVKRSNRV